MAICEICRTVITPEAGCACGSQKVSAETITMEIGCNTSNLLEQAGREIKVLAMPFKLIDIRLKLLADLIKDSGTDEMKKKMKLLGYLPD